MVGMSMERGGFGNVARAEVCESHRVCWSGLLRARSLGGRCVRSRAGYGCAGSAYLLEPVLWSSVTEAGLFSMELLKKIYHLQLKNAGKFWSFLQEPSRGRVGSACCSATVWTLRCLEAGGFIGSVRVREQHVRVRSVRDWAVCAHFVLWAAALWACTLIAWVTLGWVTLVGMQDAGACIGRVGAGRRFSRRGAQRHLGAFGGVKVVFQYTSSFCCCASDHGRVCGVFTGCCEC